MILQVLDRVVESFMFLYDLSLMETLEITFLPVWSETEKFDSPMKEFHRYFRRAFGSLAQGPAAIIARQGDEVVFTCDALGLRPIWFGSTEKEYFASSEKGVVPLEEMICDPRPLAPGEKMGLLLNRNQGVEVFEHQELQRRIYALARALRFSPLERHGNSAGAFPVIRVAEMTGMTGPSSSRKHAVQNESPEDALAIDDAAEERAIRIERTLASTDALSAMGWTKEEVDNLMTAVSGKDPLSGLGYDGPLAAFSKSGETWRTTFRNGLP